VTLQNVSIVNAAESKITSISALTDYDVDSILSNPSHPAVIYNPYYEDVDTLDVEILKTSDNSIPSKVQLSIFGCADASSIATKAQLELRTTTTSPSCKIPFSKIEMSN